ncbi:hypothetical protein [Flexivirga sp. B27]
MTGTVLRRLRSAACHPVTWLILIVLVPIAVAYVRAVAHGWAPEGDDAVIADRMRAVFSGRPPLMGQRSTSILTEGANVPTHHLGPLEYYFAAPVAALLGFSGAGILLSVAVGNAIAAAGSIIVAFRMRAWRTAVPVALAVLVLEWSLGPEQLVRPLNVYVATLPMLLVLVCAWALIDGDLSVLWVYAVAASFVAQANLAFVPFVVGLTVALLVLAGVRRLRRLRMWRGSTERLHRIWKITAALLFAVWLPTLLELLIYQPNNLQQLIKYSNESADVGASWPHALAYTLDRLSPLGFGRFHNTYRPDETGLTVVTGALGALLLALGALAGTRRPRTAGSFACGLALVAIPIEAWGLTYMAGFTVGYWLLPTLVIAVFGLAALAVRATELVPRDRVVALARRTPAVWRAVIAVPVAAALVVLASVTAASPSWAAEDAARHASSVVTAYLDEHAQPSAPVLVQGSGAHSLSVDSAIGFQLERKGFDAYYMLSWPVPEDTDPWHVDRAPPTRVSVQIAERTDGGKWSKRRPKGWTTLDLGRVGSTELRAWVNIPEVMAR